MAKKVNLWYKHDVRIENDPSYRELLENFGGSGAAVYHRVKELLYQRPTHELEYNNQTFKKIGGILNYTNGDIKEIIDYMIKGTFLMSGDLLNLMRMRYDKERNVFFSLDVKQEFKDMENLSYKRSKAGKKGMKSKYRNKDIDQQKIGICTNGISRV